MHELIVTELKRTIYNHIEKFVKLVIWPYLALLVLKSRKMLVRENENLVFQKIIIGKCLLSHNIFIICENLAILTKKKIIYTFVLHIVLYIYIIMLYITKEFCRIMIATYLNT